MSIRTFGFDGELAKTRDDAVTHRALLTEVFDASEVIQASERDDRLGTDFWVVVGCQRISVDVKARKEDFAPKGSDDLALEIYSVVESKKVGWTRDPSKNTSYVIWFWADTRRFCLVPFVPLRSVFSQRWEVWAGEFETATQHTGDGGGWHSQCVYVPRLVVWREIFKWSCGTMVGYKECNDCGKTFRTWAFSCKHGQLCFNCYQHDKACLWCE